ncbi:MAG: endonuclease domain-containing protein, partial [Candidatus Margulisiibacteriota bacterium]
SPSLSQKRGGLHTPSKAYRLTQGVSFRVRSLRRNQTPSEALLWQALRNRKLENKKFLRQYPISFDWYEQKRLFIADFYCAEKRLVIEVDGKIHDDQKDYDDLRTWIINKLAMKVVRYKNEDIDNDLEKVLDDIKSYLR